MIGVCRESEKEIILRSWDRTMDTAGLKAVGRTFECWGMRGVYSTLIGGVEHHLLLCLRQQTVLGQP